MIITFYAEGELNKDGSIKVMLSKGEFLIGSIGSDYPTPEELLLASALSCLMLTVNYIANEKNVKIEAMKGFIEGKIDPKGFHGDPNIPPGLLEVNYEVEILSNDDKIKEVLIEAEKRCPLRYTLVNGVKVNIEWRLRNTI
jgi:uncharacterized OsmC-like protein